MKYHIYQRSINRKGKKVKAWYYWFYDENGKQVRRSCGNKSNPCLVKRDAQSFVEKLEYAEKQDKSDISYNEYCREFYQNGSLFLVRQHKRGVDYKPATLYQRQLHLQKFLSKFGSKKIDEVSSIDIDDWLIELNCSNSTRNHIQVMIEEITGDMRFRGYVQDVPVIKKFKLNDKKIKGILNLSEINLIFPKDVDEFLTFWQTRFMTKIENIAFGICIYVILTTGMRSGEARALQWNQLVEDDVLLINAQIDSSQQRTSVLKKGVEEDKRWRVAILPTRTVEMLKWLKELTQPQSEEEYIFTIKGHPYATKFLLTHFQLVLQKHGIDAKSRNVTVHSLRYMYNTLLKPVIEENDLRTMIGHTSRIMTEYYDKSKALDYVPRLLKNKQALDTVFN